MRSLGEAEGAVGIRVAVGAPGLQRGFIKPVLGGNICVEAAGVVEFRVVMIESIEELCPELEVHLFSDGEKLEQRNIPVLSAGSLNNVSALRRDLFMVHRLLTPTSMLTFCFFLFTGLSFET